MVRPISLVTVIAVSSILTSCEQKSGGNGVISGTTSGPECTDGLTTGPCQIKSTGKWIASSEYNGRDTNGTDVNGSNAALVFTIPRGWYDGTKLAIASDTALTAANIINGATIFGVNGTAVCQGAAGSGTIATAQSICSRFYAYGSNGTSINGSMYCPANVPMTVPSLILWSRADEIVGASNGGRVYGFHDLSGNANDFVYDTNAPTYLTGAVNSLPALHFNGTTSSAGLKANFRSTKSGTVDIFIVARINSYYDFGAFYSDQRNGASLTSNSANTVYLWNSNEASSNYPTPSAGFHIYFARWAAGSSSWAIDGAVPLGQNFGTLTSISSLYLGRSSSGNYGNVDVSEFIAYNAALSTADRQLIEGYLAWKYNLKASLPADHPYFSTAPANMQSNSN